MTTDNRPTAMEQKIFTLGLTTETISVYLLCCTLVDTGAPVSAETLQAMWNGTPEELNDALAVLEKRHILERKTEATGLLNEYRLEDPSVWES